MIDQKIVTARKGLEDYYREVFTGGKTFLTIPPDSPTPTGRLE